MDGNGWVAQRQLAKRQRTENGAVLTGAHAERQRVLIAFLGKAGLAGLVTPGLLKTGGLGVFGNEQLRMELMTNGPATSAAAGGGSSEAAKRFLWLHRVGNSYELMGYYNKHFKSTQMLQTFLQRLRMFELNSEALSKHYVNNFIGGTPHGLAILQHHIFEEFKSFDKLAGSFSAITGSVSKLLNLTRMVESKEVDISAHRLFAEGQLLYNIATFNLGRTAAGGDAICLVGVDQALTDPQLAAVRALPHVKEARVLNF